jgi:hypothetical protein
VNSPVSAQPRRADAPGVGEAIPLHALELTVSVRLGAGARTLLGPLAPLLDRRAGAEAEAEAVDLGVPWSIEQDEAAWWLHTDRSASRHAPRPELLLGPLVHEINHLVTSRSRYVTLHAGGVARGGSAIVLAGQMEAGKTTLTTGLLLAGWDYLTDEAVAVDPVTFEALPYPKPLKIDRGSQHLFPTLARAGGTYAEPIGAWHVPVAATGARSVRGPVAVAAVVLCRYDPSAGADLRPISRAEALLRLTACTFRFAERSQAATATLAGLVRGADCYELITGDLDLAVAAVLDATG